MVGIVSELPTEELVKLVFVAYIDAVKPLALLEVTAKFTVLRKKVPIEPEAPPRGVVMETERLSTTLT